MLSSWRVGQGAAANGRAGYFGCGREMSRLLRRFDDAAAGRGGVVLLAGEPGIGPQRPAGRQLMILSGNYRD